MANITEAEPLPVTGGPLENCAAIAYDEHSIKVLHGLDPVRKPPGMYIGDTDDGSGLHHMIYEVVDNAIDERLEGYCDTVSATRNAGAACAGTHTAREILAGVAAPRWPAGSTREGLATGAEITFLPSTATFTKTDFDFTTLEHRLRELAFLNSGVTLVLTDLREVEPKTVSFHFEGGLEAFVG